MIQSKAAKGPVIQTKTGKNPMRTAAMLMCVLTAVIVVAICSKSSFLYPLNDWQDTNCYLTVGKSIWSGVVPYRDLFEQKGPFLYFLYAFASLISYRTFFGVYLLEVFCCTVFLYYSYKIVEMYSGKKALYYLPFLAVAVYTSRAFVHGGSAEEICFPILSMSLYYFLKAAKAHACPSIRESFLIGLFSSCIFWTKFTVTGIYVGWFLVFSIDMIIRKKAKDLFKTALLILAGLMAGTLPFVLYFGLNHSIHDWLEVYIYDNLFRYGMSEKGTSLFMGIAKNLMNGIFNFRKCVVMICLIAVGGIYCIRRKWVTELLYVGFMLAVAFVFCYIGGRAYSYYALAFAPYACLGLVPICDIIAKILSKRQPVSHWLFAGYAVLIAVTVFLTPNRYLMGVDKNALPQFQFAEIISDTPNATLLNYGFMDGGFYTTTGIVPNCRSFCKLNIPIEELNELQDRYIREGLCDYIVTTDKDVAPADTNHLYSLVKESQFFFAGENTTFHLYRLN